MKLKDIYDFFIREGITADLRTKEQVRKSLNEKAKTFKRLPVSQRKFFDKESLKNPFADTRLLWGRANTEVRRILVGIDIDVPEILLADRLSKTGQKIDLVLAHHPEGIALAGLHEVMALQTDVLCNLGIEQRIVAEFMNKRIEKVSRSVHSANHLRSVDAARLLGIPFLCCHTPADNHVASYLQRKMDRQKPKTLQDVLRLLWREPEYRSASYEKAGPVIVSGKPKDKAGRIFVDMTGGTEGTKDIYGRMSQLGIQTLLSMHLSEEHFNKVKSELMNVVVAGHMASDNLGMNLLIDKLEKKFFKKSSQSGKLEIVECSGFRRVKR